MTKKLLHVGCGLAKPEALPAPFRGPQWTEVRLDVEPSVKPDIVASITDMSNVPDGSFDALYSSQNLEHVYPHEVPMALREFRRVLQPKGFAFISVPDLQEAARWVAEDKLEDSVGMSPAGPIAPIDILYGWRAALANGHHSMAHRCGFTARTLLRSLEAARFAYVFVQKDRPRLNLWALAFKMVPSEEERMALQAAILPGRPASSAANGA